MFKLFSLFTTVVFYLSGAPLVVNIFANFEKKIYKKIKSWIP